MSKKKDLLGAGARAALTLALGVASAATATPAIAQDEDTTIVVTATRRDQALQDVPVAVTPVTSDMIENSGIRDVQDLTSVAPALQFNVSESESSATARLRGVGTQGSNPGLESAVGIFVDGVYRARNGVALGDLGDVQQIEVLRGPQGTLFGRNTSAGLISITTRSPDLNDFEATGEATYGDFNESRLAVGVNIPLIEDTLGLHFFGSMADRDGFLTLNADGPNTLLGPTRANDGSGDTNTRGAYNLRGQLLWEGDSASFRMIMDYAERDEACCGAQIYDPALLNGNPVTNLTSAGLETPPTGIPYGTLRTQWVANLGGYGPNVNGTTPLGAQGAGNIGDRQGFSNFGYDVGSEDYGVSGELNWETGIGDFTSITAYRNWTGQGGSDSDYSQADLVFVPEGGSRTEYRTFTQEFRLAGEWGRLDWLLGAFYSHEEIDRDFAFATGSQYGTYFAGLDSLISGGSITPGLGVAPTGGSLAALYNPLALVPADAGSRDSYSQSGDSFALFTHNIFALTENTDLTVGLRFTTEDKHLTADFNTIFDVTAQRQAISTGFGVGAFGDCNPLNQPVNATQAQIVAAMRSAYCVPWLRNDLDAVGYDQDHNEDEWSGVVSLRHEFSDNISAYASVSRGYKGGGFNMDRNFNFTFLGGAPNTEFAAELVDAHEIGIKTQWFDGDLLLNFAIYQNEYENFQLNAYNGIQFVVTTVPEVLSDGVEVDAIWRTPIEGLSFQGGIAYTDARYGSDCTLPCAGWVSANRNPITGEPTLARLPDSQLTNAPEWTATTSFTYERPIGSLLGLAYIDARYVDDQNTGSDLRPSKVQPAYTLVNARFGIGAQDESWSLEFWARNLFDEEYAQIMFDVPLQQGTAGPTQGAFLGDPRTYGVTLRARY